MYCGNCGNENKDGANFCLYCGVRMSSFGGQTSGGQQGRWTKVEVEEPKSVAVEEEDPWARAEVARKKRIVIWVAGLLIVAVAVGAWLFWRNRDKYAPEGFTEVLYGAGDGNAVVIHNDEVLMEDVERAEVVSESADGNTAIFYADEALYITTKSGYEKLADVDHSEDDYYYFYSLASMASSGKAAVYWEKSEEEYALYWYNCSAGSKTYIATVEEEPEMLISHNGKYVVYDDATTWQLWSENHATRWLCEKEKNSAWVVSDKGCTYFYRNENESDDDYDIENLSLISVDADGGEYAVLQGKSLYDFVRNRTGSQGIVAVQNEDGENEYYFIEEGEGAKKIDCEVEEGSLWLDGGGDVTNLRGQIYQSWDYSAGTNDLLYLNKELEFEVILKLGNSGEVVRAYDNSAIYAIDEDDVLYRIDPKNGEKDELAEDVAEVVAAGKKIAYYVNEEGVLRRAKGDKTEKVARDVEYFIGTDDGGVLYIDEDGKLYREDKNGKDERIDEDVDVVARLGKYYLYSKLDDRHAIYISKNGKDFEKLYSVDLND